MPLNHQHTRQIIALYCILFYVLMIFKWCAGLFLYQLQPLIYNTRFDLLTWAIMDTGLPQALIAHPGAIVIFDVIFYALPLLYWLAFTRRPKLARIVALLMLVFNWLYVQCYTLYPANSIESYSCWLLFPLLFLTTSLRSFYFVLYGLRYFFLFFFASAGVWKIVQSGMFNYEQMSGVLLYQHKEFLASSPAYWLSNMYYWFINRPAFSYPLYVAGTVLELCYCIGFFTRRFDGLLLAGFVVFLILDVFFMRIYYWEMCPVLLTLLYSRYQFPAGDGVDTGALNDRRVAI